MQALMPMAQQREPEISLLVSKQGPLKSLITEGFISEQSD